MSDVIEARWYEVIGIYRGARNAERFAPDEAKAERDAREIRDLYHERGYDWAVYIAPHYCDPDALGVECICAQHLTIDAARFSSNALRLAQGPG